MIHAFRPNGRPWCAAPVSKGERVLVVLYRDLCPICIALIAQSCREQRR